MIGRFSGDGLLDHPPSALIESHEATIDHLVAEIAELRKRLRLERQLLKAIKSARVRRAGHWTKGTS